MPTNNHKDNHREIFDDEYDDFRLNSEKPNHKRKPYFEGKTLRNGINEEESFLTDDLEFDQQSTEYPTKLQSNKNYLEEMESYNYSTREDRLVDYEYSEGGQKLKPEYKKSKTLGEKIKFLPANSWIFLRRHGRFIKILGFILLFFIIAIGSIAGIWTVRTYSQLQNLESKATDISEGSIVFDRNNEEIFRFSGDVKREVISIDKIPEEMKVAIVAIEDENFYDNAMGIPWQNMIGAAIKCAIPRQPCRGGSGLSQQLIKNITDDDERTLDRKARELLTAIKFNQDIGNTEKEKEDKVLELYLNWVPFGRNNHGVQTASQSYFGHNVDSGDLTPTKACYLASMVQLPSYYNEGISIEILNKQKRENADEEIPNPAFNQLEDRKNICLQKMFDLKLANRGTQKLIQSQAEVNRLKEEIVEFKPAGTTNVAYGHLKQHLTNEIINKFDSNDSENSINASDLETKGYKIYTTFDKQIQDRIEQTLQEAPEIERALANNAAATVLSGENAEVIALIGSRDFNNNDIGGQVNVMKSPRQPGSSFKPYVYAAALEDGFNPSTVLLDVSTDFGGGYRPKNFSGTTSGITNIRRALQDSLNIPAVKAAYLGQGAGSNPNGIAATDSMIEFANRVGVETPFYKDGTCGVSSALGGCEVVGFSHVNGFHTLLWEGVKSEPRSIIRITSKDKEITEKEIKEKYPKEQVVNSAIANQITNILSDYSSRSTAAWGNTRFNIQLDDWTGANAVAAKTGTTNDVRDMWTVGGTPYYTVGIWVGNTDNKQMDQKLTSSSIAAPIWKRIMEDLHEGLEKDGFSTTGLKQRSVDPQTGLLTDEGGTLEWMTDEQIKELEKAEGRLSDPNFDPLQSSILETRTPIARRRMEINKVDSKLIPKPGENENIELLDFEFPEELIEETECRGVVSEFPLSANWREPAEQINLGGEENNSTCPTEQTDLTRKELSPVIDINVTEKTSPLPNPITIGVQSGIDNSLLESPNTIQKLEFLIGSRVIAEVQKQSELEVDLNKVDTLPNVSTITVRTKDRFGFESEISIPNVNFTNIQKPKPETPLDKDEDGIPDSWELNNNLDPNNPLDADLDLDGNGLTNLDKYILETFSKGPDTDNDLIPDSWELNNNLDPNNPLDADLDIDNNGLTNLQEYIEFLKLQNLPKKNNQTTSSSRSFGLPNN